MAQVLVIGVGAFDGEDGDEEAPFPRSLEPLPSVAPAVAGLAAQLAKAPGLTVLGGGAAHDVGFEALTQRWRHARRAAAERGVGETVIVHFAGHGVSGGGQHALFLATRDSDRTNISWTAPQVATWLAEVEADPAGPQVLLLLDVCSAGRSVVQQLLDGVRVTERRAWVIAACAPAENTYQARFTSAATVVLERLLEGRMDLSPTLQHVPVETLAREIDRELAKSAAEEDLPAQSVLRTAYPEAQAEIPPFLPNPSYRETPGGRFRQSVETGLWQFAAAVDPALDPLHFISRASGAPQQHDITQGCFFTGRVEQLGRLKRWLEAVNQPSLMVVTGSPGSGKSALLGVVACLAHPQLREVTRQIATAIPRDVRPELNPNVAAVHARQRGPSEVLSSLASQLGLGDEPSRGWSVRSVLDRIKSRYVTPVTVIVDALDESSADMALVSEVLIPLARGRRRVVGTDAEDRAEVLCRVLVGTRPWWERYSALLDELSDLEEGMLDLDRIPLGQRTTELSNYLCDVLETSRAYSGPGTAQLRKATADAVALRLGEKQTRGAFLLASLFAHYLIRQEAAPPLERVIERIPSDLPAMLDLHLDVLQRDHPAMPAVLAAAAHGYGQGMPLEVIYHLAKAFVAPGMHGPDLTDTRKALQAASFYLRFSTDTDGRRLYRFYHQSLVDHLRVAYAQVDGREICTRVLDTVPGPASLTSRSFGLALPYVLRHAAQHAAEAGVLDNLLLSASFLVHCDPQQLSEHLRVDGLRAHFSALISQSALSPLHAPWQRREWLRHTAAVWGESWLVEALDALEEQSAQPPRPPLLNAQWGTAERFAAADGPGESDVAVIARCAARWLAVLGTPVHVEVWDVRMGVHLSSVDLPADCALTTLGSGQSSLGTLAAAGTSDGQVIVWNLETETILANIHTDSHTVVAVAIDNLPDMPVVVACGGGEVTVYDLSGGRLASMDVLAGWLSALEADDCVEDLWEPDLDIVGYDCTAAAVCNLDGIPVVVAGAVDGALHLWNVDGSDHRVFPGGRRPVTLVKALDGPGGPFVVTGAEDGARLWDLRTGGHRLLLDTSHSPAGDVLIDDQGRPSFVATGSEDAVAVWHLDDPDSSGHQLCRTSPGVSHTLTLAAHRQGLAAVGMSRSQTVLISHSADDPEPVLAPWVGHDADVEYVAVGDVDPGGCVPAISVDALGHFRVWDASRGAALLSGRLMGVTAVAAGTIDGVGAVVLAHGWGDQGKTEIIGLGDVPRTISTAEWGDTVRAVSIDAVADRSRVTVRLAAGLYAYHPQAEPLTAPLHVAGVTDPRLVSCYARTRWNGQDVTVVGSVSDTPDHGGSRLTLYTPNEDSRELAQFEEGLTCVAAGSWNGHEAIAVGTETGTAVVNCLTTGRELARFPAHSNAVSTVDFVENDGRALLVTSGEDDNIRVWDSSGGPMVHETSFPATLANTSVCADGVFAGFGERVAFFTWAGLGQQPGEIDQVRSR